MDRTAPAESQDIGHPKGNHLLESQYRLGGAQHWSGQSHRAPIEGTDAHIRQEQPMRDSGWLWKQIPQLLEILGREDHDPHAGQRRLPLASARLDQSFINVILRSH